ncbi:hypothetical protein BH683_010730 [Williamsia sp. 1138]|uniref:hypothetical protein n=1 Tax=Williamsia sp. 1138 TaxID=1903117 RepID=UPI000B9BF6EE|nr:hypothetical protein [Williamsia sp. 1138]OZG29133.1 hypothetical protein BH683_010730 [Williamsia sp. 1138]
MRRIRIASITSIVGAVLATAAAFAPSASADVVDTTVMPGISFPGNGYGTGCTYLVVAKTADSPGTPSTAGVSIVDYNQAATFFPTDLIWNAVDPYFVNPVIFDHAFTLWTPTAPGQHAIMAYQTSAGGPVEIVEVEPATPVGPACFLAP